MKKETCFIILKIYQKIMLQLLTEYQTLFRVKTIYSRINITGIPIRNSLKLRDRVA